MQNRAVFYGDFGHVFFGLMSRFLYRLGDIPALGHAQTDGPLAVTDGYRRSKAETLAAFGNPGNSGDIQNFLVKFGLFSDGITLVAFEITPPSAFFFSIIVYHIFIPALLNPSATALTRP